MIKKVLKPLLSLLMVFSVIEFQVASAAGISVVADTTDIEVGQTVNFTVTVENGAGTINVNGSSEWFENESKTYSKTYNEAGSFTFEVSGVVADFTTEADENVYDSVTINVKEKEVTPPPPPPSGGDSGTTTPDPEPEPEPVKSSDASLWSLTVDKGELSPEFDAYTTSYTVKVTNEESEITIDAEANHSEASVSGTGTYPISLGENSISITVKAEDGTKKTYTVNVIVEEKPLTSIEFNGQQYGILQESNETQPPKGFQPTTMEINGEENTVFVNKAETMILIHAIGPDEKVGFYIYDQDEGIIGLYRPLTVDGKEVFIIPIPENLQTREAMAFATMTINDEEIQVWSFNDAKLVGYSLLYVMDENGQKAYYVYDENEVKLLLYPDSTPVTYDDFLKAGLINKEPVNYGLYGGIGAAILLIVILFVASKKKKTKKVVEENKEEIVQPEPVQEVIEDVVEEDIHPIETDLNKIKDYQEHELDTNLHVEEIIQPIIPVIEEEDEEEWISDDFYKTLLGDED